MKTRTWEIIRREYLERVTKKSFWIGTVLMPVLMLAMLFVPGLLMQVSLDKELRIAVIDRSGKVFEPLKENLEKAQAEAAKAEPSPFIIERREAGADLDATLAGIKQEIGDKKLEGCLIVGPDFDAEDNFHYFGRNVNNLTVIRGLQGGLNPIVVADRLTRNNINAPPEKIREWIRRVELVTFQVAAGGDSKKSDLGSSIFITFTFVMILYVSLLVYGIANLRGVLEEKTTRIMEVLLANFTAKQIMTGKLIGIGLVGLTQMLVYSLTGGVIAAYGAVTAAQMSPELAEGLAAVNPMSLVYFVVFFVLGYFIFSAMFLAIGSLCSTEEDAQNMQGPVIMLLVVPMVSTMFFISNPDSLIALIISSIPVFTPMVLMMRILVQTPPLWQILLSIVLSVAFMVGLMWAVAKIFRIGVLMYGKRPSVKEIIHWFKAA